MCLAAHKATSKGPCGAGPSGAQSAFIPSNSYWSGSLPTLELGDDAASTNVTRVYYMSCLTVISQMRTNLRLIANRTWPNGNGNINPGLGGIGGSRSWWWDEALTSTMLALLEPEGRPPTFQAWLAHDDHPGTKFGHGTGNGYAMDCEPVGSTNCGSNNRDSVASESKGPEYGFYCYNPWAFYMAMSNHLRINNDTGFLLAKAANSNMTVEDALEGIVTDWQEYLIPDTHLVDYGPAMDGFSPTYKHVMPGCSQGNNVWMLRDFASFKDEPTIKALVLALLKKTLCPRLIFILNLFWSSRKSNCRSARSSKKIFCGDGDAHRSELTPL